MANKKPCKITLQTKDGAKFEVEKDMALQSGTIMELLVDTGNDNGIILVPNVTAPTLECVIELWKVRRSGVAERLMPNFAKHFLKKEIYMEFLEVDEVVELAMAVNYLDCRELIDITRKMVEEIAPYDAASYFGLRFEMTGDM